MIMTILNKSILFKMETSNFNLEILMHLENQNYTKKKSKYQAQYQLFYQMTLHQKIIFR